MFYNKMKLVKSKGDFLYTSSWPSALSQISPADGDSKPRKRSQGQRARSWQNWATCSPPTLFALVKWLLLLWRLSLASKVCERGT